MGGVSILKFFMKKHLALPGMNNNLFGEQLFIAMTLSEGNELIGVIAYSEGVSKFKMASKMAAKMNKTNYVNYIHYIHMI